MHDEETYKIVYTMKKYLTKVYFGLYILKIFSHLCGVGGTNICKCTRDIKTIVV